MGVRDEQREQTRRRLLAAARGRFEADGFEATRLRDVAADAEVSVGAVFVHFADKCDLLHAALFEDLEEALDRALGILLRPRRAFTRRSLSVISRRPAESAEARVLGPGRVVVELETDSAGKVDNGSELVGEAGKTMSDVVQSVKHVHAIISDIARASREQSTGIQEVNRAIAEMDTMTQQNAALVEQAAAAAKSMQDLAIELSRDVAVFRINAAAVPQRTQAMPEIGESRLAMKKFARDVQPIAQPILTLTA